MSTSDPSTSCNTISRPSSDFRSSAIDRRPRSSTAPAARDGSAVAASTYLSTRTTSQPMSESTIPQNGIGPMLASSTTLTPASGPLISALGRSEAVGDVVAGAEQRRGGGRPPAQEEAPGPGGGRPPRESGRPPRLCDGRGGP